MCNKHIPFFKEVDSEGNILHLIFLLTKWPHGIHANKPAEFVKLPGIVPGVDKNSMKDADGQVSHNLPCSFQFRQTMPQLHKCALRVAHFLQPRAVTWKYLFARPPRSGVASPSSDLTKPLSSSRSSAAYTLPIATSRPVRFSSSSEIGTP